MKELTGRTPGSLSSITNTVEDVKKGYAASIAVPKFKAMTADDVLDTTIRETPTACCRLHGAWKVPLRLYYMTQQPLLFAIILIGSALN